jgi:hypothetical protein
MGQISDHFLKDTTIQQGATLRSSPDCPPGGQSALLRHIGVLAAHYPTLIDGFDVREILAGAVVLTANSLAVSPFEGLPPA